MNEKEIYLGGFLPCLNCGETIDMANEIHLCDAPKGEWLAKQKEAKIILPSGVIDLKNGQ